MGKYRRLMELAQGIGFEVWFLQVVLDTSKKNIERVRLSASTCRPRRYRHCLQRGRGPGL